MLLSTRLGWASAGRTNGEFCGLCDHALSTQALQNHAPVSFISETSLLPQIYPVPSLYLLSIPFFIDIFPCCLLITRVTDSTAGMTKCGEVGSFPSAQKEWERQAFFFSFGKKISSQSEARVTARADRLSMCVLYKGPKRFWSLNQCCTCFLFPLSNFTFSKETCLSFPDTETHELSSPTEKRKKHHSTPGCTLGSSRRAYGVSRSPFFLKVLQFTIFLKFCFIEV